MELRDNTYILIKEANNRGSVGIMSTKHYKMVYDRLNDNQIYKKNWYHLWQQGNKQNKKTTSKVSKYYNPTRNRLMKKILSLNKHFLWSPKIHSSTLTSKAIAKKNNKYVGVLKSSDLKLQPIVTNITCPTQPLSDILDKIFKPFVLNVKSYIRDRIGFLERCSRVNNENSVLASVDVVSLYTNILHS